MLFCLHNKKNTTRRLEDMNFIFAWQKQCVTHSLRSFCHSKIKFMREWVKYCFCHAKIKFISLRHRVISSIRKMLLYNCKQGFKQSPSESIKREFFCGGGGVIFAGIALKLEKVGPAVSSFNSCPENSSNAYLYTGPLLLDSIVEKTSLRACLNGGGGPQVGELTCGWSSPIT